MKRIGYYFVQFFNEEDIFIYTGIIMETNALYENHPLSWLASVFCCVGVCYLLSSKIHSLDAILKANMFLPTYGVGILAWLLHGLEINSYPLIFTCCVQLIAVLVLLRRSLLLRNKDIR